VQHFVANGWDLIYRALAEDLIGESKAAELLGRPLSELVAADHGTSARCCSSVMRTSPSTLR
jgi:hypothetical protein